MNMDETSVYVDFPSEEKGTRRVKAVTAGSEKNKIINGMYVYCIW
jgi:hypothetical protein